MKKALVFVAAFALVLVAGVAVAFMATPSGDVASHPDEIKKPTTTSTSLKEQEKPAAIEEVKEEINDEKEPPKEEPKDEPEEEKDVSAPDLVILFPEDGQHFKEKKVAFEGKTEPGARVFAGKYEADVDDAGNWRIVLILTHDGANRAVFVATDEAGNKSEASVKAFYDAPETTDKEEPKDVESYEFVAHQQYGSCGEELPYDKFYGKGAPGTKIWIESKYGGGSTVIGESGEWFVKVDFPEAPCGQAFEVVLETNKDHRKVFEFIRICEESGEDHKDK
jgi:hypothetical protein